MVRVFATQPVDIRRIDLYALDRSSNGVLEDLASLSIRGTTYTGRQLLWEYPNDRRAFAVQTEGGTTLGLFWASGPEPQDVTLGIKGLRIAPDEFTAALSTPRLSDDAALWAKAFAGDDHFVLSSGADAARGWAGEDRMEGRGGDDRLFGDDGIDRLSGGSGNDRLTGGADRDLLNGGTGADVFVIAKLGESGPGWASRDVIEDFVRGQDKVSLALLDPDAATAGDQRLGWSSTGPAADKAWASVVSEGVLLRADVTGDGRADVEVFLQGLKAFSDSDVLL